MELKKHISDNTRNTLVGSQWVVMQIIEVSEGILVAKILGISQNHEPISGTIENYRNRQYCGIGYHSEKWCKGDGAKQVAFIQQRMGHTMAFYNPYQDRVILL